MSEEKREILEHLVEYLQDKIDIGYHKIFYNDDMYDEKTIDCINAINDTLEENKRLNNIIKDIKDYVNFLVIYNQTINGKFSETQWGQDILDLIGSDKE